MRVGCPRWRIITSKEYVGAVPGQKLLLQKRESELNSADLIGRFLHYQLSQWRPLGGFAFGELTHQSQGMVQATCHLDPELSQETTQHVHKLRTLPHQQIAHVSAACCSADFLGTNRIVGRVTASQIASASPISILPRFT